MCLTYKCQNQYDPISITYDKIILEFKSNEFIFQNADNHHNDYFLPLFYHRHFG